MGRKIVVALLVLSFAGVVFLAFSIKDLREAIEPHRATLGPMLARLPAIYAAAKAAPPTQRDELRLDGPKPPDGRLAEDSTLVYLEDLEEPREFGNVPARVDVSRDLTPCVALFETHRKPYDPMNSSPGEPPSVPYVGADSTLRRCAKLRYLYVLRTRRFAPVSNLREVKIDGPCSRIAATEGAAANGSAAPAASPAPSSSTAPAASALPSAGRTPSPAPTASSASASASAAPSATPSASSAPSAEKTFCKVFDGGYLEGDVLAFDLRDAKQVGAFRLRVESPSLVDVTYSAVSTAAETALANAVSHAVLGGIQKALAAGGAP